MKTAWFIRFASAALALGIGSSAWAQQPMIVAEPLPQSANLLNIAEIDANARLQLAWTASFGITFGNSYEYEITYDRFASEQEQGAAVPIRFEDVDFGAEPDGNQPSGQRLIVYIRPQQIIPEADLPSNGGADDQTRDLVLKVFPRNNEFDSLQYATYVWSVRYDTRAPSPPVVQGVVRGEKRLEVHWSPSDSGDLESYSIVYCPDVRDLEVDTSTAAGLSATGGVLPCAKPLVKPNIERTFGNDSVVKGLQIGVPAALAVRGVDEFGNVGLLSNVVVQTPVEVSDFWELYQKDGGSEEGGFCFIATAATGSYAHPTVRVLRWFRDGVLARSPVGRALVLGYYNWSPPIARKITADSDLRDGTRWAVLVAGFLALMVLMMLGLGIGTIGWAVVRRVRPWLAAFVVLLFLVPSVAQAKRPDSDLEAFGFGFEFKGGPYLPDIGNSGGGTEMNPAFVDVYGSNSNALFTLGVEMQLYRGIGSAGLGATFGFMQFVGRGRYASDDTKSFDTTVFNIAPFTLVGVYRFDWLADRIPFPFVPYLKGGIAYYLWWVTTGTGDVARVEDGASAANDRIGRGGKWGLTGTLGVSLLLNIFDPPSAQSLFASTGVRGTYLFAEVQANKIDGFGAEGFDLSDATWNIGVFLEM